MFRARRLLAEPPRPAHPAQLVVGGFALVIVAGTGLLLLPPASQGAGGAPFVTALFTSTSAVCVTGLVVVDTPTYWSGFGQVVILVLIQVGGFGIMTLASLLTLLLARRIGLGTRLITQTETQSLHLGDLRRVVLGVAALSAAFEGVAAVIIGARLWLGYDYTLGSAAYRGVFHAVSAFNNAGFALWSDSLVGFVSDGWISLTVALAVIAGGLGFPVWLELFARLRGRRRSTLHTKLTLVTTGALLVLGTVTILGFEWSNDATIGELSVPGKLLASFFQGGAMPRTAGFNSVDVGQMDEASLLIQDMLMFVGGASASTAGGIKVTTFALLALMALAEARGEPDVTAFGRRVPEPAHRQALLVAFVAMNAVVIGTLVLIAVSDFSLSRTLFEAISAFSTVGLSTGITGEFSTTGKLVLIGLMFIGRTGPYTVAVAVALRERRRRYRFPEERPIVG
ncbi:MAG: TrkH family potassium uptake protein [Solirubrobacteraceae bacterium]